MSRNLKSEGLWSLLSQTSAVMSVYYVNAVAQFVSKSGVDWLTSVLLCIMLGREPDSTGVEDLRVVSPYAGPSYFGDRLEAACSKGYLTRTGERYALTEGGRAEIMGLLEEMAAAIEDLDLLPAAQTARLADLLETAMQAALAAMPPPEPGLARHINKFAPPIELPMARVASLLQFFGSYRSDCHRVAWQSRGLSGPAAHCLTWLWGVGTDSVEGIYEHVQNRGYPQQTYVEALAELESRSLIERNGEVASLTDSGRAFREEIEGDTQRVFSAAWDHLTDEQLIDLVNLITALEKVASQS